MEVSEGMNRIPPPVSVPQHRLGVWRRSLGPGGGGFDGRGEKILRECQESEPAHWLWNPALAKPCSFATASTMFLTGVCGVHESGSAGVSEVFICGTGSRF